MFVELTKNEDGGPLIVNLSQIATAESHPEGGTRLLLIVGSDRHVAENLEVVKDKLRKHLQFVDN